MDNVTYGDVIELAGAVLADSTCALLFIYLI